MLALVGIRRTHVTIRGISFGFRLLWYGKKEEMLHGRRRKRAFYEDNRRKMTIFEPEKLKTEEI